MPQAASLTLYVATGSAGKLRDFGAAAAVSADWSIQTLPGLPAIAAPAEDGATFLENALLKAIYYSGFATNTVVIADDSGLSVDALDGAPGVYSARYASMRGFEGSASAAEHEPGKDERNNRCLLAELARSRAAAPWPAQYRCVLAAARAGEVIATAEGAVHGEIATTARGGNGFGYDPYFYLPRLGRSMAELDLETRLSVNHRGDALRALLPKLAEILR